MLWSCIAMVRIQKSWGCMECTIPMPSSYRTSIMSRLWQQHLGYGHHLSWCQNMHSGTVSMRGRRAKMCWCDGSDCGAGRAPEIIAVFVTRRTMSTQWRWWWWYINTHSKTVEYIEHASPQIMIYNVAIMCDEIAIPICNLSIECHWNNIRNKNRNHLGNIVQHDYIFKPNMNNRCSPASILCVNYDLLGRYLRNYLKTINPERNKVNLPSKPLDRDQLR